MRWDLAGQGMGGSVFHSARATEGISMNNLQNSELTHVCESA